MSFYGGNLENDCIAILNWCYRHQSKKQSYRVFADELGIPLGRASNTSAKATGLWQRTQKSTDMILRT